MILILLQTEKNNIDNTHPNKFMEFENGIDLNMDLFYSAAVYDAFRTVSKYPDPACYVSYNVVEQDVYFRIEFDAYGGSQNRHAHDNRNDKNKEDVENH